MGRWSSFLPTITRQGPGISFQSSCTRRVSPSTCIPRRTITAATRFYRNTSSSSAIGRSFSSGPSPCFLETGPPLKQPVQRPAGMNARKRLLDDVLEVLLVLPGAGQVEIPVLGRYQQLFPFVQHAAQAISVAKLLSFGCDPRWVMGPVERVN